MTAITRRTPRIHVPDLGPRGEGWVALQAVLFVAVIATGIAGPLWAGPARAIGALAGLALIAGRRSRSSPAGSSRCDDS